VRNEVLVMALLRESIPRDATVRRNLSLDLVSGVGLGVTMALAGALLPTIARREGLSPIGLAVLAAAPFVGNLLGVLAGRYGPRTTGELALTRLLGAAALVLLVLLPRAEMMVIVAVAFWMSLAFASPFQMRVWGVTYPRELWGRMIGIIGTGRAAAAGLAALVGGVLADRLGGPEAVAVGGVVGIACALAAAGVRAPAAKDPPRYSVAESVRALTGRPELARVALAQGFWGGGVIAAAPILPLVQVDRLALSMAEVGQIAMAGSIATTLSYIVWGAVIDRRGSHVPLRVGSAFGVVALVIYAFAPAAAALWVAAILLGLSGAAIEIGIQRAISDHTALDERAAAMSGWNALTGARGVAAPFVAGTAVAAGIVDATGALLICSVVATSGMVLYLRMRPTALASEIEREHAAREATAAAGVRKPAAAT
jgi:MFS family permease